MGVSRLAAMLLLSLQVHAREASSPSGDEILSAISRSEEQRARLLPRYTGLRQYSLRNTRFHIDASMTVRVDYGPNGTKTFTVLERAGSASAHRKVFEPLLTAEAEASQSSLREQTRLSSANYQAQVVGQEVHSGRDCWVLLVVPKHPSKFLIQGKIWVDRREYEPIHLQGRPAASVSFWVGEPMIIEEFARENGFWMPKRTISKSSGRLLGLSELTIDHYGYEFCPRESAMR